VHAEKREIFELSKDDEGMKIGKLKRLLFISFVFLVAL